MHIYVYTLRKSVGKKIVKSSAEPDSREKVANCLAGRFSNPASHQLIG